MPDLPLSSLPPRLRMLGVSKRFGPTVALADVSLHVYPGEVLALVGENGAGKSTLMKVLSGAHPPDAGTMELDGQPYAPRDPLAARRAGVAMIYQELAQAPDLSVAENILLGAEPTAGPFLNWRSLRQTARKAMARVGRPDIDVNLPLARLSPAQRQLVEIARAVGGGAAGGSKVLVLDEPTSSLTQEGTRALFDLIRSLQAQGLAIIYISHFLEEVRAVASRIEVLRDGRSVGGGPIAEFSHNQIVALMVGRTVEDLYPRSPRTPGPLLLEVQRLTGTPRPANVSLQLHRGEVLGFAGLIGAGRTEFLRTLFGLDRFRSGTIRIADNLGPASPNTRWRQRVGIVSEDRKTEGLATALSIAENTTLASHRFFTRPAQMAAQTRAMIATLAIRSRSPGQPVADLSGGNQQKVALARLLHHGVDLLLLDEPTRGIDVGAKAQIYRLIDELACEGKAILIVSSYLPELLGVCDRIAVMCKGTLGPARPVAQWSEHTIMLAATGTTGEPA